MSREAASDRFGWYLIYLGILYCKIRFIVLLSAQKRDINHVGQKNPFLGNQISCHYGEDSCNGQINERGDACKSVQSWYKNSLWAEKRERGWRKVSQKQACGQPMGRETRVWMPRNQSKAGMGIAYGQRKQTKGARKSV